MKVSPDIKLDFDDVLIKPKRSDAISRQDINLLREFQFYHSSRTWKGVPIMAANMDSTGTFDMAEALAKQRMITCLHKHYDLQTIQKYCRDTFTSNRDQYIFSWISIGIQDSSVDKLKALSIHMGHPPDICIDVANGYTNKFVRKCAEIREKFPASIIMAGNVCTPEMVSELILKGGVDICKIGLGSGGVCTTRVITGVGFPQLSAIMECVDAAHGLKSGSKRLGLICADGGCRTPGDVCKAFGAGADFVMLGGMLAGTDECEGEWVHTWTGMNSQLFAEDGKPSKKLFKFYGMSSSEAQDKHNGGLSDYRASEGKCVEIPYKGPVNEVLQQITGGLRSACAYIGADCLKDMAKCCSFTRVNRTHNTVFGG